MGRPCVLLVNPNRMRPPIAPVGLDYVAAGLKRRGYDPVLCDLSFADDWARSLIAAVDEVQPIAVGFSVRNIDDAYFASRDFVLDTTAAMIRSVREATRAPIVLGGVGFSAAPAEILRFTGADFGIAGDGEEALPALLDCLQDGQNPKDVPGVVVGKGLGGEMLHALSMCELDRLPAAPRDFVDNPKYFREGGQGGIETKRGCDRPCLYCVDPVSKGRRVRLRPAAQVAAEFEDLCTRGVDVIHLCDSEFNIPPWHAFAVCEALTRSGLDQRVRWYTYAAPDGFDEDLARAMARAGCVGINFGVDHADAGMLSRWGRRYGPEAIRRIVDACRKTGLVVMCDMLLGGPGETRDTIAYAIDFMRGADPDRVGLSCGVRVYPHTPLAHLVLQQGPPATNPHLHGVLEDNLDLLRPVFYVDAAVGPDIHAYVARIVGDDRRFFHADPGHVDRNYNYNDNSQLSAAIRAGARGAYWDILRRLQEGEFREAAGRSGDTPQAGGGM